MKGKKQIKGKSLEGTPYFISDQKLGEGAYGSVFKAYNRQNPNQQLVAKIISINEQENTQSIETQLEVIRELPRHENLVNCVKAHIASQKNLYIIMEYCNSGSLASFIKKMVLMPEEKIWSFIVQISKGYQILYDANLLHRDIKPDNILIHNKVFKLADFGLAKHIKDHNISENQSYCGSPLYISPQISDKSEGNSKVDVFSLGCVIYQLAYDGTYPYYNQKQDYKDPFEFYQKRKGKKLILKPKNKKGQARSQQLRQLLMRMLQFDQQKRISWQQIFNHPKIKINTIAQKPNLKRTVSNEQVELQQLNRSLLQVNRSSAKIQAILQKQNVREQAQQSTLQLINFEQLLEHKQFQNIEQQMFRLKITQLTILHSNSKLIYIIKDNLTHHRLHKHILDSLERLSVEALLYLMKINEVITSKIQAIDQNVTKDLIAILLSDRSKLQNHFKTQMTLFKNMQYEKQLQKLKEYDLRRYQNELYTFLTEYCDFPKDAKQRLSVVCSILIDVYDSSLKLTDMVETKKIMWQKYQDMNEIQTKMDQICYKKLQLHEFHTYLLHKQHIKLEEINEALKKMGLLFA